MTKEKNIITPFLKKDKDYTVSKYSVLGFVYFFFNSVIVPKGLLFTTILSPFLYLNQIIKKRNVFLKPFLVFLLSFDIFHLTNGINLENFITSNVLFTLTYFTIISVYHFVNLYNELPKLFKQIAIFNFMLALVAIPFFFMEPKYQDWFWWVNREAMSKHEFPRLKLFTYEASYYSLLMIPIVYYYSFKLLFGEIINKWQTILIVFLPLIMSMSLGVIGSSIITICILIFYFRKKLLRYKKPFLITLSILCVTLLAVLLFWILNPTHPIVLRVLSVFSGTDTSANGRTSDSFGIAWRLIENRGRWFGIGLGQIKVEIASQVRQHYEYWGNYQRFDIPNTSAETLAIFGIFGLCMRIFIEIYLFFKTKVFTNYYRFALFIFVFIYQFTGSFITNTVEYVIWVLAFSNAFSEFNIISPSKNKQ